MQVAFLACLAVVLVLAPAAHAQGIHTGICWDTECVNNECDEGKDAAGACINSGCPSSDNICDVCKPRYASIHGECIQSTLGCNYPCTECGVKTLPHRTVCTDCIEGFHVVDEMCIVIPSPPTATTIPPCAPHCIEDEVRDGACYCLKCEEGWLATEGWCIGECGIKHCVDCGGSETGCEGECEEGWIISNDGQCEMTCLVDHCIQCLEERPRYCDICAESYGRDNHGQCKLRDTGCWDENCITCHNAPSAECIVDGTQNVTNNGRYCNSCLVGLSMVRCECLDAENECGENCLDCQATDNDDGFDVDGNPWECYQCKPGYILEKHEGDQLENTCVVDPDAVLHECHVSMCSECVEGEPDKCEVCESDILEVNEEGKCGIKLTTNL